MIELNPTKHYLIQKGDFPLNHDCILKVHFITDSGLHYQLFTCRSQNSGTLVDILSKVFCVRKVKIIPVEQYDL